MDNVSAQLAQLLVVTCALVAIARNLRSLLTQVRLLRRGVLAELAVPDLTEIHTGAQLA
jgi:hypothetical protein